MIPVLHQTKRSFSLLTISVFVLMMLGAIANGQSAVDRAKILATNEAFYEAFRTGDLDKMHGVWSPSREVGMTPPGRDFLLGINRIMAAFQLMMLRPPEIECQLEAPIEFRDEKAILICDERLGVSDSIRMMNVFAPEKLDSETEWKMIYHGPAGEDNRRT
jgi:hypothetical protein